MISIIIPVYNQAKKLAKCLESIKNQTYVNYEVIIVDDGSTDNINEIYEKYKQHFGLRLELISQENHGANPARNKGLEHAKGEFLLFCDADLIMEPNMLKSMHDALADNQGASFAYSSFYFGRKKFKLWPFNPEKLKQMPYIHTTSLIRKEHFPVTGWDNKIKRLQDWDLWLTMLDNGHNGLWIDKYLFKVQGGGTMSSWLPSFSYYLFPFLPKVINYKKAVTVIKHKHNLK